MRDREREGDSNSFWRKVVVEFKCVFVFKLLCTLTRYSTTSILPPPAAQPTKQLQRKRRKKEEKKKREEEEEEEEKKVDDELKYDNKYAASLAVKNRGSLLRVNYATKIWKKEKDTECPRKNTTVM